MQCLFVGIEFKERCFLRLFDIFYRFVVDLRDIPFAVQGSQRTFAQCEQGVAVAVCQGQFLFRTLIAGYVFQSFQHGTFGSHVAAKHPCGSHLPERQVPGFVFIHLDGSHDTVTSGTAVYSVLFQVQPDKNILIGRSLFSVYGDDIPFAFQCTGL